MMLNIKPVYVPFVLLFSLTGIGAALWYAVFNKKDEDDSFMPPSYTTHRTEIKIKIPKTMIGVLIGREGSNIRNIQKDSGARVNFDDGSSETDYRECIISGTTVNTQKAEILIKEFLASQPKVETHEMTIHQKYCGWIIGRGGQNLRQLRNMSHAKIIITDEMYGDQSKIVIKGTTDQITVARDLLLKRLNELDESQEEIQGTIQNRSPRLTPKSHLNGLPESVPHDSHSEMLVPPGGGNRLEVFVSAFVNPGQFWVQIISENGVKLDKLLDDMTAYYDNAENHELHKITEFNEGQIVAALFPTDKKWYRAEVTSVTENTEKAKEIEVFYVDYGDTSVLNESQVFELRTDFLTLRFQAIECFLAGIKPINGEWSDEAALSFEALAEIAQWVKMTAVIRTYEIRSKSSSNQIKRPVPGIQLLDSRENNLIDVGEELVKLGFAEQTDEFDSLEPEPVEAHASQSTSKYSQQAVPELSDSGSDIDGFYVEC